MRSKCLGSYGFSLWLQCLLPLLSLGFGLGGFSGGEERIVKEERKLVHISYASQKLVTLPMYNHIVISTEEQR